MRSLSSLQVEVNRTHAKKPPRADPRVNRKSYIVNMKSNPVQVSQTKSNLCEADVRLKPKQWGDDSLSPQHSLCQQTSNQQRATAPPAVLPSPG